MKIKLKAWHGVASWTWGASDDSCGICRMPFDGCCPDCKMPGDECPLVWGEVHTLRHGTRRPAAPSRVAGVVPARRRETHSPSATLARAQCSHAFHLHCIHKWVASGSQTPRPQCPMCRQDWRFQQQQEQE